MRKTILTLGFIAALAAPVPASAAAMTKSALTALNNSVITTNGTGAITGATLNNLLNNIIASNCTILDAANCPIAAIAGLGSGVGIAMGKGINTTGGFATLPLSLSGASGLLISSISNWGTNVAAALGNTLDAASGLVSYSSLAADVSAVTGMSSSVQAAIQIATNAANGLAQLNGSGQLTGAYAPSHLLVSPTAPTFTSGACTGAIGISNGTAAFTFTTGSVSCGSTATLGMPTAATGWICFAVDEAAAGLTQISESSDTASSVVLTNYSIGSSPAAANFPSGHTVKVHCFAY